MNGLLELINECSSIREYKVNDAMPKSIVYDYLNVEKNNYILLKNGKKMEDNDCLFKGDSLLVFYSLKI